MKKRITVGVLTLLLAACQTLPVMAQTNSLQNTSAAVTDNAGMATTAANAVGTVEAAAESFGNTTAEELAPDYEDPDYVKRLLLQEDTQEQLLSIRSLAGESTQSPYTGLTYIHNTALQGCDIVNGVDVSKWQADIDWEKVKAAGVEFTFIRCGYTSLSSAFTMYEDPYFRQNVQAAHDAGIKVGVYFFSNSKTIEEAAAEAQRTLQIISDYRDLITLPVVYDFEAFNSTYRAYEIIGSKEQVTQNALTFMRAVENAGYTSMVYGSPSFLNNSFDMAQLSAYDCWLANYTTKAVYQGDYTIWQYSSSGTVDGISGKADCNFWYKGQTEETSIRVDSNGPKQVTGLKMYQNSSTAIRISWKASSDADGYLVFRSDAYSGSYKQIADIGKGTTVKYRDGDFADMDGRQFYYKIVPYRNEDGKQVYGKESKILTAYLNQRYTHKLKTTTSLNLRSEAGTEFAIVTVVPEGTLITYKKYTYSTEGRPWYKVSYKKDGKSYVGYLSGSYVTTYMYANAKLRMGVYEETSTASKRLVRINEGQKVTIIGMLTDSSNRKWAIVTASVNGKTWQGYCLYRNLIQI